MRPAILAALVLAVAACAKTETPATDSPAAAAPPPAPAALTAADVAGTWEAEGMPMDKDTVVVRFTMTNDSTGQNSMTVFASGDRIKSTSNAFNGDSLVSNAGPFKSQVRKGQQVTTRVVLRMQDGKLVGQSHSKYANGDSTVYRIAATRKAP